MDTSTTPEIIRSIVEMKNNIGDYSHIIDSKLLTNAKVYKDCWIVKSIMKDNTFAGDGTKLDNCILESYSRAGKYNHLYFVNLGRHTYTGQDTIIMHTNVGAFTSISWGVTVGGGEHDFNRLTSHTFLYNPYDKLNNDKVYYDRFKKPVYIGNDVWIGANSTILRGVNIGDGAVIGANAVVTKDVSPYSIVVGNPARIVKYRFKEDIIERLLEVKWWDLDDKIIKNNCDLFAGNPTHEILDKLEKLIQFKK